MIPVILPKVHWQVTAKHVCHLRMWLCKKWCDMMHGCMVYTERAETAAVSQQNSFLSAPLWWIFKTYSEKLQSLTENHIREYAREWRTEWGCCVYFKDMNIFGTFSLWEPTCIRCVPLFLPSFWCKHPVGYQAGGKQSWRACVSYDAVYSLGLESEGEDSRFKFLSSHQRI